MTVNISLRAAVAAEDPRLALPGTASWLYGRERDPNRMSCAKIALRQRGDTRPGSLFRTRYAREWG
jgi:hypothetical protein